MGKWTKHQERTKVHEARRQVRRQREDERQMAMAQLIASEHVLIGR